MKGIFNELFSILFQLLALPIKRWFNLCVRGEYVIDDEETQAVIKYLREIVRDPTYEPQSPIEQEVEQDLIDAYEETLKANPKVSREDYPYADHRAEFAVDILKFLQEHATFKGE